MSWTGEFEQDRIAFEILEGLNGGVFVDIGATDGVTRNNSLALERDHSWRGVCIEPVLSSFTKLRVNRPDTLAIHCCVGDYSQLGAVRFHEDLGNHEISRIDKNYGTLSPCLTLNHILAKLKYCRVDFLSIDTEGNELNILSAIDFDRYQIQVIDFEHNEQWGAAQKANKDAIHSLLTVKGFRKVQDVGVDSIYANRDLA